MGLASGKCVWCGSRDLSREDVIGKQFVDLLQPGPVAHVLGTERGTPKSHMRLVVRERVCKRCNNEWMARLDDACVDIIGDSMKSGAGVSLDPRAQRVVAFWATKMALLIELRIDDEARERGTSASYIPADNFPTMYANVDARRPPPGTQVWIGATRADVWPFWSNARSFSLAVEPHDLVGYVATFCIGQVLLQVRGHDIYRP